MAARLARHADGRRLSGHGGLHGADLLGVGVHPLQAGFTGQRVQRVGGQRVGLDARHRHGDRRNCGHRRGPGGSRGCLGGSGRGRGCRRHERGRCFERCGRKGCRLGRALQVVVLGRRHGSGQRIGLCGDRFAALTRDVLAVFARAVTATAAAAAAITFATFGRCVAFAAGHGRWRLPAFQRCGHGIAAAFGALVACGVVIAAHFVAATFTAVTSATAATAATAVAFALGTGRRCFVKGCGIDKGRLRRGGSDRRKAGRAFLAARGTGALGARAAAFAVAVAAITPFSALTALTTRCTVFARRGRGGALGRCLGAVVAAITSTATFVLVLAVAATFAATFAPTARATLTAAITTLTTAAAFTTPALALLGRGRRAGLGGHRGRRHHRGCRCR